MLYENQWEQFVLHMDQVFYPSLRLQTQSSCQHGSHIPPKMQLRKPLKMWSNPSTWGIVLLDWNSFHEEIKRALYMASVRYYSVQNLTSYYLLHKNIRITIYETIMLPVTLYVSLTLSRSMIKGASE